MNSLANEAAVHSRATHIQAATIVFLAIAFVAVMARTWVRTVMTCNYGRDDVVMALSMVTYTIYASFNLVLVSWGFGNSRLALEDFAFKSKVASLILATFSLHTATMVILKISLGIFYLRIIVSRWQRLTVYISVGIATAYGTCYFFAVLFSCGLPSHFLINALQRKCGGTPETRFAINITAGLVNAGSDFILAVLPIFMIRKACMPLPAKISACLVLLLGCAGSAVSIVRLSYIRGLSYSLDFFAVGVDITIWSIIEAGLCITAASLATLRPLCRCCMDTRRRSMTAEYTARENSIYEPHYENNEWILLKRCEASALGPHELEDTSPQTLANRHENRLKRKAITLRSKVQWLEARIDISLSPRQQQQSRPASSSHVQWQWQSPVRNATPRSPPLSDSSAIGISNSVDTPIRRSRAASEPWRNQQKTTAGRARKYSHAPPPVPRAEFDEKLERSSSVRDML